MLTAYRLSDKGLEPLPLGEPPSLPQTTVWIDLFQPTQEEDRLAEGFLGAAVPTREEALEIEFSSRFYEEDGAVYMTSPLLTGIQSGKPILTPFTIIVGDNRIVTVRYEELRAFTQFLTRAVKPGVCTSVPTVLITLIEEIVERSADVLERIGLDIDRINQEIFKKRTGRTHVGTSLEDLIAEIGLQADIAAKARESLATLERLVQFAGVALPATFGKGMVRNRLKLAGRDIRSLEDHVTFQSNKLTFLLDATLGLISTQQNEVIRILTVGTGIFFPPTLIGTTYGMNFQYMPELDWPFGYPFSLGLMLVSAVIPYIYFKRKGWL